MKSRSGLRSLFASIFSLLLSALVSQAAMAETFLWPSSCTSNGGSFLCVVSEATYSPQTGPQIGARFNDGTSACMAAAGNSYGTTYREASFAAWDPTWGTGCWFDIYTPTSDDYIYQGRYFYQNWVLANQYCPVVPENYGYVDTADRSVSANGRYWCGYKPYFVIASLPTEAQCDSCNENSVAHPINPASGAMFDTVTDTDSKISSPVFRRFYNSSDTGVAALGNGWRHSYSRFVVPKHGTVEIKTYVQSNLVSSQYGDPGLACTSGFLEIQSKVPTWSGAIVSYSGENCQLTKNGVPIGSIRVYSNSNKLVPALSATPLAYEAVRDDGQLLRFTVDNGVATPPPGTSLQLTQNASGFTIVEGDGSVEHYDTNGKLLSVIARSGAVQTMDYDASGRLIAVTDSFGHQLTFTYDAQGRLSVVTQQ